MDALSGGNLSIIGSKSENLIKADVLNMASKKYKTSINSSLTQYCQSLRMQYKPNRYVLFVQIPQFIFKSFNPEIAKKRGYYAFPPTGLQHLYESLKNRNLDLRILDLNFLFLEKISRDATFKQTQWIEIFKEHLESYNPFIIGVSCMYDSGIQSLLQILEFLKRRNSSVVITGGVISTYEWKKLLSQDLCHFIIKGEGENKINYLFDQLTEEDMNFASTPSICYKFRGSYFETEGEQNRVIVNTDLIDSYSQVRIEEYYKYGSLNPFSRIAGIFDSPFAVIQMNRGCRGWCTFCSVRDFMGSGVRKRPLDKVLREMEFLINERGVRHFEWLDDDLIYFKEDFQLLLETIIERKWNITWSANNGMIATSIDEKFMQLIRDSGCIGFKIGIETGNPEMLSKVRKPASLDTFRRVSKIFNRYPEVFVGGNFMLGFPQEKFYQMMDSFHFYLELNLDWAAFTICQAIRGATAFSDFEDYFDTQISSGGENTKNFIPVRESPDGQLSTKSNVLKCLDVFKIDPNSIPDEEQIKEIWFTFNLVGNFVNNKNLKPGGRVEKFIPWVEMAQVAYPTNPYMSLFLALAYVIKGDKDKAEDYYNKAVLYNKTDYWRERFASFGLDRVLDNFPENKSAVFETIENLRNHTSVF